MQNIRYLSFACKCRWGMFLHVKSAMTAIRCISQIRHFLSNQAALTLVHSFVTSRIDSCNSLLFGLPSIEIHWVQMLQNIAARLVTRTPGSQSISQTLKKLHWLPIEKRIIFKLLLLTYKAQHGLAPSYLTDLLTPYQPARESPFQQPGVIMCSQN